MVHMASGGDPRALLNALSSMLGTSGCIKSAQEVVRIIRFVTAGGWEVLNKWLNEAKESNDTCLLSKILSVLKYLPVSVNILKQGNAGKTVKSLIKHTPEVKDVATDILEQWKEVVRKETGVQDTVSSMKRKKEKLEDDNELAKKARNVTKVPNSNSVKLESPNDSTINNNQIRKQPVKVPISNKAKIMTANIPPTKPKSTAATLATTITDSSSFMDALSVSVSKKRAKKAQLSTIKSGQLPSQTATSPVDKTFPSQSVSPDHEVNFPTISEPTIQPIQSEATVEKTVDPVDQLSNNMKPVKIGKKKKRVTWASEPNLTRFRYFELDESERVNVRSHSFHDAQYMEMMRERQTLQNAKFQVVDNMKETIAWSKPALIEFASGRGGQITDRRVHSDECVAQEKREQTVLAEIFFSKDRVSDNPAEPDLEDLPSTTSSKDPTVIPLIPVPDPDLDLSEAGSSLASTDAGRYSLPPEIADLITSAASSLRTHGSSDTGAAKAVQLAAKMMHTGGYQDEQYAPELGDRVTPQYEDEELNHEFEEDPHYYNYPHDHPDQPPDRFVGHGPPMRGKRFPGARGGPRMHHWRGGPPGPEGPPVRGMNPPRGPRMPADHLDRPPFEDEYGSYPNEEFASIGPAPVPSHRGRGGHHPRGRGRRGGRGGRGGGDAGGTKTAPYYLR
ncbi:uncharacterized protein TRIADDRAFT_53307 [Trichoplax adhaerens]|uniref:TFIIS N-terminal domain-containing protein n=1 Tax=Trichoplax adhaerens TaxID=10228 RepID=B3RNV8_TRIAD|nr:hypothetical protein TRIADDRAFT_53307 [Trichoplax adhaerens]EDV27529.1 hypothetical protein TRIADDRAFT_53307 [Trichoplax adhaerens]|eukprot:XP_002109363.1 hypothetical protein TRIADDRAFT_53307 [Trichoplax adhaerens]